MYIIKSINKFEFLNLSPYRPPNYQVLIPLTKTKKAPSISMIMRFAVFQKSKCISEVGREGWTFLEPFIYSLSLYIYVCVCVWL